MKNWLSVGCIYSVYVDGYTHVIQNLFCLRSEKEKRDVRAYYFSSFRLTIEKLSMEERKKRSPNRINWLSEFNIGERYIFSSPWKNLCSAMFRLKALIIELRFAARFLFTLIFYRICKGFFSFFFFFLSSFIPIEQRNSFQRRVHRLEEERERRELLGVSVDVSTKRDRYRRREAPIRGA